MRRKVTIALGVTVILLFGFWIFRNKTYPLQPGLRVKIVKIGNYTNQTYEVGNSLEKGLGNGLPATGFGWGPFKLHPPQKLQAYNVGTNDVVLWLEITGPENAFKKMIEEWELSVVDELGKSHTGATFSEIPTRKVPSKRWAVVRLISYPRHNQRLKLRFNVVEPGTSKRTGKIAGEIPFKNPMVTPPVAFAKAPLPVRIKNGDLAVDVNSASFTNNSGRPMLVVHFEPFWKDQPTEDLGVLHGYYQDEQGNSFPSRIREAFPNSKQFIDFPYDSLQSPFKLTLNLARSTNYSEHETVKFPIPYIKAGTNAAISFIHQGKTMNGWIESGMEFVEISTRNDPEFYTQFLYLEDDQGGVLETQWIARSKDKWKLKIPANYQKPTVVLKLGISKLIPVTFSISPEGK